MQIDKETFYMGLLLALSCMECRRFCTQGHVFQHAFQAVLQLAQQQPVLIVQDIEWMFPDPISGTYPHAEELIAFGLSSRILSLESPDLVLAHIRFSPETARVFLQQHISHPEWFLLLATTFKTSISAAFFQF
jgi:hypothetical protein